MRGRCSLSLALVGLAIFSALPYLPSLEGDFIWDDIPNLVTNKSFPLEGDEGYRWAFTTGYMGHWQPLTWLSWQLDEVLWGMNPQGFRLTNLILHALNAIILAWLFVAILQRSGTRGGQIQAWGIAIFTAWLWAVQPMRVENVAWITERRDLLAMLLILLALRSWVAFANGWKPGYWLCLGLTGLSILAKAWAITFPVVLLLLDLSPLKRWRGVGGMMKAKSLLLEKIPWALLSLIGGMAAWFAQREWAMHRAVDHTLTERMGQAMAGLVFYLRETIWPTQLAPHHWLPVDFSISSVGVLLAVLWILLLSIWLLLYWKKRWSIGVALGLAAVLASPILGLAQSGDQIYAGRYGYLASVPLFGLLAWLLANSSGRMRSGLVIITLLIGAAWTHKTWQYSKAWQTESSLWAWAIKATPGNPVAWNNHGTQIERTDDLPAALLAYSKAIQLDPEHAVYWRNRGHLLAILGYQAAAKWNLNESVRLGPGYAEGWRRRGIWNLHNNRANEALSDFSQVLALEPSLPINWFNRGMAYASLRHWSEAEMDFSKATELDSRYITAWFNRGLTRLWQDRRQEALEDFAIVMALGSNGAGEEAASLAARAERLSEKIRAGAKIIE